jgi:cytochrome oxidase Cu insertion factor (SCO1/SenC/PrrC family)
LGQEILVVTTLNRRTVAKVGLAGAVSAALVAAAPLLANPAAQARVGGPAPDFTLADTSGKTVSLKDYSGKTVVLE